jgi:hypothetical protein
VSARQDGAQLVLEVTDTGVGLADRKPTHRALAWPRCASGWHAAYGAQATMDFGGRRAGLGHPHHHPHSRRTVNAAP